MIARSQQSKETSRKYDNVNCTIFRSYCKTLFFRCILISRFSYSENLLHFNLADFPVKRWYSMQINVWWWTVTKIRVYLILRFYSNRENLMPTKYMRFTVVEIRNIAVFVCNILQIWLKTEIRLYFGQSWICKNDRFLAGAEIRHIPS